VIALTDVPNEIAVGLAQGAEALGKARHAPLAAGARETALAGQQFERHFGRGSVVEI
jgi:hypothetical protein